MSLPTLAIIGRPNVGKSTLFNRLIGKKEAIVYDQPGVTRDRHYATADWSGVSYRVMDTGGYEATPESTLFQQMKKQTEFAIEEANVIFFVVDSQVGPQRDEESIAKRLRRSGKKVFLLVNKIDHTQHEPALHEFHRLGFSDIFPISAEHGRGVAELLDVLISNFSHTPPIENKEKIMKVTIIGRPNVGKSTLLNRLFGAPRAVVHDAPGTTRDPLDVELSYEGKDYCFIDTAGIRRKSHAEGKIEKVSVVKTFEQIRRSDLVLLLLDATVGVTAQDGKVAEEALGRGRPLLILINKWDLMKKSDWPAFEKKLRLKLGNLDFVTIFPISAKNGSGLSKLFSQMQEVYAQYEKRISTSEANRIFREAIERHPPPIVSGKALKLFFMTQVKSKPPRFVVFTNHPQLVPEVYKRYLIRSLREACGFQGTPLFIDFTARRSKQG